MLRAELIYVESLILILLIVGNKLLIRLFIFIHSYYFREVIVHTFAQYTLSLFSQPSLEQILYILKIIRCQLGIIFNLHILLQDLSMSDYVEVSPCCRVFIHAAFPLLIDSNLPIEATRFVEVRTDV